MRKDVTGSGNAQRYFLIVERPENWDVDMKAGFVHFGLPERKRTFGQALKAGDLLFGYVSGGLSAFADVRQVVRDGLRGRSKHLAYDEIYPWLVETRPLVVLPRERWVPVQQLLPELRLTRGQSSWRQLFRVTIREIDEHDGMVLRNAIRQAGPTSE